MKKTVSAYAPLWLFIILVLWAGMFFPKLMDFDAAEYAGIAMRMHQTGDYGNIVNRTYDTGLAYDYLDKPHVLFWSAIPGYALFGTNDAGYRLVSILLSLLGVMATMRLGALLYNRRVGQIAGFMFICTQAILLANHDVRTDSLLTSFVVLAVWHLVRYVLQGNIWSLVWAGAFLAGGVGTKGMIAVLVAGCLLFFFLVFRRDWKTIFHWHWIILVAAFFLFLSPVMYFYYLQFDLHPEKVFNGKQGMSGIKFLLWTQSFERFAGDRSFVDNPEFSFFFHTLLWALLPWSILYYAATFSALVSGFRSKLTSLFQREQLTFLGVWAMFIIMSLSSFKLPHYLNVLFPYMCIFTAGYLQAFLAEHRYRVLRQFGTVQGVIIGILGVLFVLLNYWAFPPTAWWIPVVQVIALLLAIAFGRFMVSDDLDKVWLPSALGILWVNLSLNMHFYPAIDRYQGGSEMAAFVRQQNMDTDSIYIYHETVRTFDLALQQWRPMLTNADISNLRGQGKPVTIFTKQAGYDSLRRAFRVSVIKQLPDYHITGLSGKFLNPATRQAACSAVYLVRIE